MSFEKVGWVKQSVPTILWRSRKYGGHGAKSAFAHPTILKELAK